MTAWPDYPNVGSALIGALSAASLGYLFSRLSKRFDARTAAEAALLGTGPAIIKEQIARITELERNYTLLWDKLGEALTREIQCQNDLAACRREHQQLALRVGALEGRLGGREDG